MEVDWVGRVMQWKDRGHWLGGGGKGLLWIGCGGGGPINICIAWNLQRLDVHKTQEQVPSQLYTYTFSVRIKTMTLGLIKYVIFDMDGLLLDTETIYTQVQQEILQKYGKEFTWELKAKMMGRKALEAGQILIDDLGLQGQLSAQEFIDEREKLLDEHFPNCQLMPGVQEVVSFLKKIQIPMAVATSSHRRHFELKTSKHGEIFKLFELIVTGDEVSKGKPDPELFVTAMKRLGSSQPENCLVFEDAPVGVQAALNAGMKVVMIPDENLPDASQNSQPHLKLQSMTEFHPQLWFLKMHLLAYKLLQMLE
eukprot:TRINITY_DN11415_c1_g1_i1.p1 TRINITY_DN11415_c1_g1~~TRINITY_DN11415_c1_g1_i1.p1  ORF type:complete len:309 (-),score=55.28 TRINITY_DN11415_c1_g1_i1:275-1201(-)